MADNVTLQVFPKNRAEALTLLFLKAHSAELETPEKMVKLYIETYDQIMDEFEKQTPEMDTSRFSF